MAYSSQQASPGDPAGQQKKVGNIMSTYNGTVSAAVVRGEIAIKQDAGGAWSNDNVRDFLSMMIKTSRARKMAINQYAIVLADHNYSAGKTTAEIKKRLENLDNYKVFLSQKWCKTRTGKTFPAIRIVIAPQDSIDSEEKQDKSDGFLF